MNPCKNIVADLNVPSHIEIYTTLNNILANSILKFSVFSGICLITCLLLISSQKKTTNQFAEDNENDISLSFENSFLEDAQSILSDEETESFKKIPIVFIKNNLLRKTTGSNTEHSNNQQVERAKQLILIQHSDLPPPLLLC